MATNYSGWEQILGGVLGMGIPDRAQITGQTWLIIQHNAPANPNMHQIWAATWKVSKNSQSITVYLNPALYAAGGAWDTFLSVPSANLSGVSAGNYGTLPMSPPTFTDAQLAVASVASWLNAATQRLSGLSTDVASGSSGFQGSGGQVFTNLLTRLRGVTDAAYTQMTSPVAYSDAIAAAGDSASRFLTSLWSAYTSWTQAPPSSPLGALVQVLQGIGGGPVVSANFPGAATPGPAAGSVVNGGASALAPLPPVAGASPQPGAVVANQSLSAQAALLVPTALLTSGAAGTPAGSGTRGPGGSPGTVSGLGALLAASQLGVLSGAIGRGAASRVTRGGAASGGSSGQVAADGAAGGIAGQDINSAPVAGFSLGSDLNGPLLSQSAVPALAIRPGSPTVTVTAFNTKAVPSVPALPGGDSGSVLSTLAVPGGATAGMPGTLATGGGPGESAALAVQGAGTPGGMDAGAMSGAGGAFGARGEAGLAAGPMFMMPGMMAGGGGEQGQERVRDAFAPEDEGFWGTEPGIPEVPITPDGQDDPEPDWPDTEYSPFEAIGIGADRRAGRRGKTRSDERVR